MFKKFMPMVNTTLGPDICRWRNRYYVTFNSGGVGHSNGHSVCLLSSVDGERWEKVIERAPQSNGLISTDATRGALCPKLLPTDDRLIVMFYYYAPGETNVSDEQKQHLKGRWLELNGSEQNFERWIGHHEVSFRTGSHLRKTVIRSHRRNRCSTQVGVSGDPIPSMVVTMLSVSDATVNLGKSAQSWNA